MSCQDTNAHQQADFLRTALEQYRRDDPDGVLARLARQSVPQNTARLEISLVSVRVEEAHVDTSNLPWIIDYARGIGCIVDDKTHAITATPMQHANLVSQLKRLIREKR